MDNFKVDFLMFFFFLVPDFQIVVLTKAYFIQLSDDVNLSYQKLTPHVTGFVAQGHTHLVNFIFIKQK